MSRCKNYFLGHMQKLKREEKEEEEGGGGGGAEKNSPQLMR